MVDQALVQEVLELTQLLREDPSFSDFRAQLIACGMEPGRTLMAGLIEYADGVVQGKDGFADAAFVSATGEVFYCELSDTGALAEWTCIDDVEAFARDLFPAVTVAVDLALATDLP